MLKLLPDLILNNICEFLDFLSILNLEIATGRALYVKHIHVETSAKNELKHLPIHYLDQVETIVFDPFGYIESSNVLSFIFPFKNVKSIDLSNQLISEDDTLKILSRLETLCGLKVCVTHLCEKSHFDEKSNLSPLQSLHITFYSKCEILVKKICQMNTLKYLQFIAAYSSLVNDMFRIHCDWSSIATIFISSLFLSILTNERSCLAKSAFLAVIISDDFNDHHLANLQNAKVDLNLIAVVLPFNLLKVKCFKTVQDIKLSDELIEKIFLLFQSNCIYVPPILLMNKTNFKNLTKRFISLSAIDMSRIGLITKARHLPLLSLKDFEDFVIDSNKSEINLKTSDTILSNFKLSFNWIGMDHYSDNENSVSNDTLFVESTKTVTSETKDNLSKIFLRSSGIKSLSLFRIGGEFLLGIGKGFCYLRELSIFLEFSSHAGGNIRLPSDWFKCFKYMKQLVSFKLISEQTVLQPDMIDCFSECPRIQNIFILIKRAVHSKLQVKHFIKSLELDSLFIPRLELFLVVCEDFPIKKLYNSRYHGRIIETAPLSKSPCLFERNYLFKRLLSIGIDKI